jgi:hypothetical protein
VDCWRHGVRRFGQWVSRRGWSHLVHVSHHWFSVSQNGKFFHKDIPTVWADFSEDMHHWLLRLTEEFDLTFPSKEENCNIVPCLLPNSDPQVLLNDWILLNLRIQFFFYRSSICPMYQIILWFVKQRSFTSLITFLLVFLTELRYMFHLEIDFCV